jgi:hypothetical protein
MLYPWCNVQHEKKLWYLALLSIEKARRMTNPFSTTRLLLAGMVATLLICENSGIPARADSSDSTNVSQKDGSSQAEQTPEEAAGGKHNLQLRILLPPVARSWDLVPRIRKRKFQEFLADFTGSKTRMPDHSQEAFTCHF